MTLTATLLFACSLIGCEPDSGSPGVLIDGGGATFEGSVAADGGAGTDAGPGGGSASCPPSSGPTTHGITATTETWTAAASPHIIPNDLVVTGTLTIEPCATVLIAPGKVLTVEGPMSTLVASGTAAQPIHIGPSEAGKPFGRLTTLRNGKLRLAYVNIDGGGAASTRSGDPLPEASGTLDVAAAGSAARNDLVFVDHVTVEGSASNGLVLRDGATFGGGSNELVVHGAALHPLRVAVSSLDGLPSGRFTGNAKDEIAIPTNGGGSAFFREDTTLHDLGVPYRVTSTGSSVFAGELVVGGAFSPAGERITATLTIEPGVTMRFEKGAGLHISDVRDPSMQAPSAADARLIAIGTAARPIVFTSAEASPAPGDWLGLSFAGIPQPTNALAYVHVDYAGGAPRAPLPSSSCDAGTSSNAAIRLHGAPSAPFITNTTIGYSSSNGIDRSWRSSAPLDLMASNVFTSVAGCNQTWPVDAFGSCPAPVPCPK